MAGTGPEVWPDFVWTEPDDLRDLVRYVNVDVLHSSEVRLFDLIPEGRNKEPSERSRRIYDRLVEGGKFTYDRDPFTGYRAQRIRDAREAVRNNATCIDLALIHIAACLHHGLYPYLLITPTHALVAVHHTRRLEKLTPEPGDRVQSVLGPALQGLWTLRGASARALLGLGRQPLQIIDIATVTRTEPPPSIDDAEREGRGRVEKVAADDAAPLFVLDVPLLMEGPGARAPYALRPFALGIHTRFLPLAKQPREFGSRRAVRNQVTDATSRGGIVVLHGPAGSGKSVLALDVAQEFDRGYGWYLRADDGQTVDASLAGCEAAERGVTVTGGQTELMERQDLANEGRNRLRDHEGTWVVLADNADGPADEIRGRLPRPGPRQILLVTTTNDEWIDELELLADDIPHEVVHLEPLDAGDMTSAYPSLSKDEQRYCAGLPLLANAYERFQETTGQSVGEVVSSELSGAGVEPGAAGARLLWRAIATHVEPDAGRWAALARAAAAATVFPPEHVDHALLAHVSGMPDAGAALNGLGLLTTTSTPDIGFLHRLLAAAVRADTPGYADAVIEACADDRVLRTFDEHGSMAQLSSLVETVSSAAAERPSSAAGRALAGVAGLLELYGAGDDSVQHYVVGATMLDRTSPEDWRPLAAALHAAQRKVNQRRNATRAELATAMAAMDEVVELRQRHSEHVQNRSDLVHSEDLAIALAEVEASRALQLLLEGRIAERDGDEERTNRVHEDLRQSAGRRSELLEKPGRPHALAVRAQFNVAAQLVRTANIRKDPDIFDQAFRQYETVLAARRNLHRNREVHPHIATCLHGMGVTRYNKAVFAERDPVQKRVLLDESFDLVSKGLVIRRQMPPDPQATEDLLKSYNVLGKIIQAGGALARKLTLQQLLTLRLSLPIEAPEMAGELEALLSDG